MKLKKGSIHRGRYRECHSPRPVWDKSYGRWLEDVVKEFGTRKVSRFKDAPHGWSYEEWQSRTFLRSNTHSVSHSN